MLITTTPNARGIDFLENDSGDFLKHESLDRAPHPEDMRRRTTQGRRIECHDNYSPNTCDCDRIVYLSAPTCGRHLNEHDAPPGDPHGMISCHVMRTWPMKLAHGRSTNMRRSSNSSGCTNALLSASGRNHSNQSLRLSLNASLLVHKEI